MHLGFFFVYFKKDACKHLSHTNADRKPATTKKKICNYTCYNLTNNTDKTNGKKKDETKVSCYYTVYTF